LKKRLLITNDDGIFAEGIQTLSQELFEQLGENLDLYIIAPDHEQSATSHAITMHRPLRVEEVRYFHNPRLKCWSVNGTPSDCVKLAVEYLLDEKPDLIVSGINRGSNLGTDVLYSGTFSAAAEGVMLGIPALAVSHTEIKNPGFACAAQFVCNLIPKLWQNHISNNTLLNINVPSEINGGIHGVEVTRLGSRRYRNTFQKRVDPRGRNYYWLAGELDDLYEEGSDVNAVKNHKVSITPVHFDITDYSLIEQLKLILDNEMLENLKK